MSGTFQLIEQQLRQERGRNILRMCTDFPFSLSLCLESDVADFMVEAPYFTGSIRSWWVLKDVISLKFKSMQGDVGSSSMEKDNGETTSPWAPEREARPAPQLAGVKFCPVTGRVGLWGTPFGSRLSSLEAVVSQLKWHIFLIQIGEEKSTFLNA